MSCIPISLKALTVVAAMRVHFFFGVSPPEEQEHLRNFEGENRVFSGRVFLLVKHVEVRFSFASSFVRTSLLLSALVSWLCMFRVIDFHSISVGSPKLS